MGQFYSYNLLSLYKSMQIVSQHHSNKVMIFFCKESKHFSLYLFIYSFSKHLVITYYVLGTVLVDKDLEMNFC